MLTISRSHGNGEYVLLLDLTCSFDHAYQSTLFKPGIRMQDHLRLWSQDLFNIGFDAL